MRPSPSPVRPWAGARALRLGRAGVRVAVAVLAACVPAPEGPAGSTASRAQAVVGGAPAPGDAAVVALVARRTRCEEEAPLLLCSGVLVAPDAVLTAAHCLETFGADGQYEVFLGEQLLPAPRGRFVRVARAVAHPGYQPDAHALDVALLRLAHAVDVPPLALPAPGEAPAVAQEARVVGYGETRDGAQPAGQRRQGMTAVTAVEPAAFRASAAPGMSCTGDSGGPVLVQREGREVLAGVTVSGDVACRSEALAVRVDAVLADFLAPQLAAPAPTASPAPLAPEALCVAACETGADCPSGLACVPDAEGRGRCMVLALQEGSFGAACTTDAACGVGSTCARLESDGADACRCFTPCEAPGEPAPPRGGCGTTGAGGGAGGGPVWGVLGLLALLRRRGLTPRGRAAPRGG